MKTLWFWRSLLILSPLISLPAWAADPAAVQQLKEQNQCPGCDLTGADLAGANLFGANLVNADLTRANLAGANLGQATLIDANLTDANLTNAHLYQANLADADLTGANLAGAYLREQQLTNTHLDGVQLRGANLSYANLTGASLVGADLRETDFSHAHLSGTAGELATLFGTKFTQGVVNLAFCSTFLEDFPFGTLFPASIDEERDMLSFADLSGANLAGANFHSAILIGANLQNTNLQNTDLRSSCLPYAELKGADLTNAQLDGANVKKAMFAQTTLRGATGVDLTGAYRTERERDIEIWQEAAIAYLKEATQAQRLNTPFVIALDNLGVEQPPNRAYRYTLDIQEGSALEPAIAVIEARPQVSGLKGYVGVVIQAFPGEAVSEWSTAGLYLCESEVNTTPPFVAFPIVLDEDLSFTCQEGTKQLEFSLF